MILRVDGKEMDFMLENEQTLGDVAIAVDAWLRTKCKRWVKHIFADGKEIFLASCDDLTDSCDTIEELSFESVEFIQFVADGLEELEKQIAISVVHLDSSIKKPSGLFERERIYEHSQWIVSMLRECCMVVSLNPANVFFDEISLAHYLDSLEKSLRKLHGLKLSGKDFDIVIVKELLPVIKILQIFFSKIRRAFFCVFVLWKDMSEELFNACVHDVKVDVETAQRLSSKIATAFQTGDEAIGYSMIRDVMTILEKVMRFLTDCEREFFLKYSDMFIGENSIANWNKMLKMFLNNLIVAMESGDGVLIADLMEYELNDLFSQYLSGLFEKIVVDIKNMYYIDKA